MLLSPTDPYFDILIQHLSDLMIEASEWPESLQTHLYSFWADVDQCKILFTLFQAPMGELQVCLNEVCCKLESLEQIMFNRHVAWHLDMLRKALISISYIVDEWTEILNPI
jgi:hypothetical protein